MKSTIFVEKVNKMNGGVTAEYLDKMVKREAAIVGNKELAIDTLCRRYGFTPAQIKHIRGGRAKDPRGSLIKRVKLAYLDYCEGLVKKLQHEIAVEKALNEDDALETLENEISTLAKKVSEAKARNRMTP